MWTEELNQKTFGKCFSRFGHGHDYLLEVRIRTTAEDFTHDEANLIQALQAIQEFLDHKHLNFEITAFFENQRPVKIPTTENFCLFIYEELSKFGGLKIRNLRLYERPDLFVEILLAV